MGNSESIGNLISKYCNQKMKSKNLYLMKKDLKKLRKNITINDAKIENNETILICEEKKNEIPISNKEKNINDKINQTLEKMCEYGNKIKIEIEKEKKMNPEKYISTKEALQLGEKNELFPLGLIADILEKIGIEVLIEKDESEIDEYEATTISEYLTNGFITKKKYNLKFDFGKKRNEELLNNKNEYEKFKNNLKNKLSKDWKIPPEKIIVAYPQRGSFSVQIIFQSDEFNDLNLEEFKQKFINEEEYEELKNIKEIHSDLIIGAFRLTKKQLDSRGNRQDGWAEGEKRGGKEYYPPKGWIGIGLKVLDKYDNNEWIGMVNSPGEWNVAYHGVGYFEESDGVKRITGIIVTSQFKPGRRQACEDSDDIYHKGKKVGKGVYCTPKIEVTEKYAGISEINGKKYKTALMVRVKPDSIRCPINKKDYWVVNGTTDDKIRPYRILFKKI